MSDYMIKSLKELFEQYAVEDSEIVKDGIQKEIQLRLNAAYGQLDNCRTGAEANHVYESFLDI